MVYKLCKSREPVIYFQSVSQTLRSKRAGSEVPVEVQEKTKVPTGKQAGGSQILTYSDFYSIQVSID
jgi:hypothetical protein